MSANMWRVYSAAVPTTAAMVALATGTAIKTHLQITAPAGDTTIVAWGVSFETVPTAVVKAELINTTTVAGGTPTTVLPANLRGTSAWPGTAGFNPGTEGSIVATTEVFDQIPLWTNYFHREMSLGREALLESGQVLRVRMTTAVTINALCWIDFE